MHGPASTAASLPEGLSTSTALSIPVSEDTDDWSAAASPVELGPAQPPRTTLARKTARARHVRCLLTSVPLLSIAAEIRPSVAQRQPMRGTFPPALFYPLP